VSSTWKLNTGDVITIRPREPDDDRFIVSGWSSSYRTSRDLSFVQMDRYADTMHGVVASVLARPRTEVLVADGSIMPRWGFLAFERSEVGAPPIVMYTYVAQPYRRRGVARGLFASAGIDPALPFEYAARTQASWELLHIHRKAPLARYNPLRARFAEEEERHVEEERSSKRTPVVEHRRGGIRSGG